MTDPLREIAKEQHRFGEWPGRDAQPLPRPFLPQLELLPGFSHERRQALSGGDFIDHFAEGGGEARISVRVTTYSSAGEAHEGLVDILEETMAPQLPRCRDQGLAIGDPCFCGSGDPVAFAAFARANVLIRVDSTGQEPVSVAAVAAELDRQLMAAVESSA